MNNILKQQLDKVQVADLSNFDAATNTYFIPQKKSINVKIDKCYIIKLLPTTFSDLTLKINWNQGKLPPASCIKAEITNQMGKMIKVTSIDYNPETKACGSAFWNGWLMRDEIEILEECN